MPEAPEAQEALGPVRGGGELSLLGPLPHVRGVALQGYPPAQDGLSVARRTGPIKKALGLRGGAEVLRPEVGEPAGEGQGSPFEFLRGAAVVEADCAAAY